MPSSPFTHIMDASSTRMLRGRSGILALLALVLSGCSGENLSGPGSEALPFGGITVSRPPAGVPRPDIIVHHVADDSASAEFTVTPSGGVFALGPHAIYFPANSICDPATSSYGPGEWDAPCEPASGPVRFRAEVRTADGRSWVDFTPAVRFVPSAIDANGVWLYMKTASISSNADSVREALSRMSILYSPAIGADGVNEALADASLRTYVWLDGGVAFRRIKHFSGYNIHDGYSCRESLLGADLIEISNPEDEDDDCRREDREGGLLDEVDDLIVYVRF
jgi:hypothetical protein